MRKELIFWFDQPPKVGKGCFNYITKVWGNKVIYAFLHDFSETRKSTNWNDNDYGNAAMVQLSPNIHENLSEIFDKYPNAIHVIDGFKSEITKYLEPYILLDKYKFVAFSERPGVYGTWWKRLLKYIYIPISERIVEKKYSKHIYAYLPLGNTGVRTAEKYGWDSKKLYPFMYDPVNLVTDEKIYPVHQPMRFLYVGRFSRYTKGTDTLLKAINRLKSSSTQYTLDMVGGYGDMREEVLNWMENKDNIKFLGLWDSNTVGMNMKKYDVCIVPSKFDGWNLLVNEAVRAHIGVIATDEAVSDELITSSGAGIVVPAKSPDKLAQAIDFAIANPKKVYEWKKFAKEYSTDISSQKVGDYLINVIEYECLNIGENRPKCPWIKE